MPKIAVIKTGGKQYKVKSGDLISIEKLEGNADEKVSFDTLLIAGEDGSALEVGAPSLGEKVTGTIVAQKRDPKILVIKFKAKSRYRRRQGHRQNKTEVKISEF